MKIRKTLISLGLSLAMALPSASAIFAADEETVSDLPYQGGVNGEIDGGGGMIDPDGPGSKDVVLVTVSTKTLDFKMDPSGSGAGKTEASEIYSMVESAWAAGSSNFKDAPAWDAANNAIQTVSTTLVAGGSTVASTVTADATMYPVVIGGTVVKIYANDMNPSETPNKFDNARKKQQILAATKAKHAGKVTGDNILTFANKGTNDVKLDISILAQVSTAADRDVKTVFKDWITPVTATVTTNVAINYWTSDASSTAAATYLVDGVTTQSGADDVMSANNALVQANGTENAIVLGLAAHAGGVLRDDENVSTTDFSDGSETGAAITAAGDAGFGEHGQVKFFKDEAEVESATADANAFKTNHVVFNGVESPWVAKVTKTGGTMSAYLAKDTSYGINPSNNTYEKGAGLLSPQAYNMLDNPTLTYTQKQDLSSKIWSEKGTHAAFKLVGAINPKADWTDWAGSAKEAISVKAVYDIDTFDNNGVSKYEAAAMLGSRLVVVNNIFSSASDTGVITMKFVPSAMASGVTMNTTSSDIEINGKMGNALGGGYGWKAPSKIDASSNTVTLSRDTVITQAGATVGTEILVRVKLSDGSWAEGKITPQNS